MPESCWVHLNVKGTAIEKKQIRKRHKEEKEKMQELNKRLQATTS